MLRYNTRTTIIVKGEIVKFRVLGKETKKTTVAQDTVVAETVNISDGNPSKTRVVKCGG